MVIKTWRKKAQITWDVGGLSEGTVEFLEARSDQIRSRLFALLNHYGNAETRLADAVDSPTYFDVPADDAESLASELTSFMSIVLRHR